MPEPVITRPMSWTEWRRQYSSSMRVFVSAPEWISEWLVYKSQTLEIIKAIEIVGKFGFIFTAFIAAWGWIAESAQREQTLLATTKAKHYRAWDLINSARGSTGNGGRVEALQDLNEDGMDLNGGSLAKSNLSRIQLNNAALKDADFSQAVLFGADLTGSFMGGANFQGADLSIANLSGANLRSANLQNANLWAARLVDAELGNCNLQFANLTNATLRNANIDNAKMDGAVFCRTTMPNGVVANQDCDGRIR